MKTVSTIEELKENLDTMDRYIANKHDPEYSFAIDLIKKGICFVPRVVDGHVHFYPSRFIGYVHNTMTLHENNENKDGRETNPVISRICKTNCFADTEMEKAYRVYCEELGFTAREHGPFGVERKFWPPLD